MKRVPPSVRMKEEVEALLQGQGAGQELEDVPMDGFVRGTARYMLQVAIEAEATAFLGRGHYRRGDRTRVGWRNGYEPKRVQSEARVLELAVPQLRSTEEPFRPAVTDRLQTRTADLESLVRGMYVRGLSHAGRERALHRHVWRQSVEQEYGEPGDTAAESGVRVVAPARSERPAGGLSLS